MKRTEFDRIAAFIRMCYPKEEKLFKEEGQIEVWYEFFKSESMGDVLAAVQNVAKKSVFPPSIADIIAEIHATKTEPELTPGEAWQIVVRNIGRYGRDRQAEALEDMPEAVRKAVRSCGYGYLCNADAENAKRAFLKEYGMRTNERKLLNG